MRNVRRKQVHHDRKIKHLVFITSGVLMVIYLTVNLIAGENGLMKYLKLKSTKQKLLAETMAMQNQNADIQKQIETLEKNPAVIEELAREYGLTKEGELIYKFNDQEQQ
jgi:cell division protein FtsB